MLPGLAEHQFFRFGGRLLSYQPNFLSREQADTLFEQLLRRKDWAQPGLRVRGKSSPIPRMVAWEGDPGLCYSYSGLIHTTSGWQPQLRELRDRIEKHTVLKFNFALLNLYRDGNDSMGWHSDNEAELGDNPMVASVSLGAERDFHLRATPQDKLHRLNLEHGSLLLMPGKILHHLPRRKGILTPRINISLRCVKVNEQEP